MAIVAAIAVPTAFGSIEKAKDSAALASLDSMCSVIRSAHTIALADKKFQENLENWKTTFLYYENNKFQKATPGGYNDFEDYMMDALNSAKISVPEKAYFYIFIQENTTSDGSYDIDLRYAPNGAIQPKLPNIQLTYPYYTYTTSTFYDTYVKYKADGTSEAMKR